MPANRKVPMPYTWKLETYRLIKKFWHVSHMTINDDKDDNGDGRNNDVNDDKIKKLS